MGKANGLDEEPTPEKGFTDGEEALLGNEAKAVDAIGAMPAEKGLEMGRKEPTDETDGLIPNGLDALEAMLEGSEEKETDGCFFDMNVS